MAIQKLATACSLLIDGKEQEFPRVHILPIDQMVFERYGRTQGWTVQDNQLTFLFFCTYNALKRQGKFTGTFDEFMDAAQSVVEAEDEDDVEDVPAPGNPTRKGH